MTALDATSVAADFGSENQPTPHAVDDALTRESMADLHPSGPAPSAVTPMTPIRPLPSRVHSRVDPKDFVSRPHHPRHHPVAHGDPKVGSKQVATRPPARRNPAARFVYWWNGWVIRTFHTKIGTVLLGTVGANT